MEASGGRRGVGEMRILAKAVRRGVALARKVLAKACRAMARNAYVPARLEQMSCLPYDVRWQDFG
jgi:hypothetical protein